MSKERKSWFIIPEVSDAAAAFRRKDGVENEGATRTEQQILLGRVPQFLSISPRGTDVSRKRKLTVRWDLTATSSYDMLIPTPILIHEVAKIGPNRWLEDSNVEDVWVVRFGVKLDWGFGNQVDVFSSSLITNKSHRKCWDKYKGALSNDLQSSLETYSILVAWSFHLLLKIPTLIK